MYLFIYLFQIEQLEVQIVNQARQGGGGGASLGAVGGPPEMQPLASGGAEASATASVSHSFVCRLQFKI
jgi:hypothetical protein